MGLMDQPPYPWEDCDFPEPPPPYELVTREEWGAVPPTSVEPLAIPVENILFSYTETEPCNNKEECIQLLQRLQKEHMAQGHSDIRYSYVIGNDTNVYECRGWNHKAGAHPLKPLLEDHAEICHVGPKGDFPEPDLSCRGWQWINDHQKKGIVAKHPNYDEDWHFPFNREEVDELV